MPRLNRRAAVAALALWPAALIGARGAAAQGGRAADGERPPPNWRDPNLSGGVRPNPNNLTPVPRGEVTHPTPIQPQGGRCPDGTHWTSQGCVRSFDPRGR
jgi:hypothetical protein